MTSPIIRAGVQFVIASDRVPRLRTHNWWGSTAHCSHVTLASAANTHQHYLEPGIKMVFSQIQQILAKTVFTMQKR